MATETFAWLPLTESDGSVTYSTRTAQFGDGYSQTVANGINNRGSAWNLTFRGASAEMGSLAAFLDRHAGWRSFFWTPPGGQQGYFRCAGRKVQPAQGGNRTVTATFTQVFRP